MKGILNTIDRISLVFGRIAALLLLILWILMFAGVVARYGFNAPIKWVPEITRFLFGASFMLAGAVTLKCGQHVSVDILVNRLSLKTQAILQLITSVVFWFSISMLLYWGVIGAMKSVSVMETSGTVWNPPVWPVKLVIPFSCLLMLFQGVAKFIRDWRVVATGRGFEE